MIGSAGLDTCGHGRHDTPHTAAQTSAEVRALKSCMGGRMGSLRSSGNVLVMDRTNVGEDSSEARCESPPPAACTCAAYYVPDVRGKPACTALPSTWTPARSVMVTGTSRGLDKTSTTSDACRRRNTRAHMTAYAPGQAAAPACEQS